MNGVAVRIEGISVLLLGMSREAKMPEIISIIRLGKVLYELDTSCSRYYFSASDRGSCIGYTYGAIFGFGGPKLRALALSN